MTKLELIQKIIKDKILEKIIAGTNLYFENDDKYIKEELKSELLEVILKIDSDKLLSMITLENNDLNTLKITKLRNYLIQTIWNLVTTENKTFYKNYLNKNVINQEVMCEKNDEIITKLNFKDKYKYNPNEHYNVIKKNFKTIYEDYKLIMDDEFDNNDNDKRIYQIKKIINNESLVSEIDKKIFVAYLELGKYTMVAKLFGYVPSPFIKKKVIKVINTINENLC